MGVILVHWMLDCAGLNFCQPEPSRPAQTNTFQYRNHTNDYTTIMANSLLEARLDGVEARLDRLQKDFRTFVILFVLLFCTLQVLSLFPPRSSTFTITVGRSSVAMDGAEKMVPARIGDDEAKAPSSEGVCLNPELGVGALFSDDRAVARFRKCGGEELVNLYKARKAGGIIAGISERDAAGDAYRTTNQHILDRMLKTGHLVDGEWRFHLGGEWRQYTSSLGCYM